MGKLKLLRYMDVDFSAEIDHRSSTIGYVFTWGTTLISQISQLQKIFVVSIIEAKYVVVMEARKRDDLVIEFVGTIKSQTCDELLHSDRQSAIHLSKN